MNQSDHLVIYYARSSKHTSLDALGVNTGNPEFEPARDPDSD